jgi:aubergine-like protein
MRKDQRSMRELAKFTRLSPTNRMNSLQIFSNRFFEARDCREVVEKYGLKFDKNLVQIKGRNLGPQKIYFGEGHT